jgi:transcriptional regulator with XRE-family HTH domain
MTAPPGSLIRHARESVGLSQAELARRIETTQSAVARLESGRSNPRLDTLDRAIAATGQRLAITVEPDFGLDETLIAGNLRLAPADRLRRFASGYASARKLREAGKKALGS